MYSYPNLIPMHPEHVTAMRRRLSSYQFEDVYGYTWGRNIVGDARRAVDRSFDRYLNAIGATARYSASSRSTERECSPEESFMMRLPDAPSLPSQGGG